MGDLKGEGDLRLYITLHVHEELKAGSKDNWVYYQWRDNGWILDCVVNRM